MLLFFLILYIIYIFMKKGDCIQKEGKSYIKNSEKIYSQNHLITQLVYNIIKRKFSFT